MTVGKNQGWSHHGELTRPADGARAHGRKHWPNGRKTSALYPSRSNTSFSDKTELTGAARPDWLNAGNVPFDQGRPARCDPIKRIKEVII